MIRRSIFVCLLMPVLSAYAQPFSFGLMGGAGLTQDFQNYNLLPVGATNENILILGSSTPERWIGGATIEARLPLHLSVEADGLYHSLCFKLTAQFGQTPPDWGSVFAQHAITWELPVLLKYRLQLPLVKPFIDAGPAFRYSYSLSHTNPSNHGFAVGLGIEAHLWKLKIAPQFRYLRWARDQNVPMFGLTTVTDQVEFLTAITFP